MTTAHAHPTPRIYWLIAFVLAVLTGLEVSVPQISAFDGAPRVWLLFTLGGIKFAAVVAFFMHLKFDKPLYKGLFLIGIFGSIPIFIVLLLTFESL